MELSRNLRVDSVSRLQPTPPRRAEAESPIADVVEYMRQEGVGCILICENTKLVGIFTERDLLIRVLSPGVPLTAPVRMVMTRDPVTVQPLDSIRTAIQRMESGGYRHLPVIDDTHRPVGILSIKRIIHYLVEHFPSTVYNLPPDPEIVPHEREGA